MTERPRPEDPADETGPEPGSGRPVRLRRAPRYRSFVLTGLLLGVVVAAAVAVVTPADGGYSRPALLGYLGVVFGLVGAVAGGLAAVLLERRR